MSIFPLSPAPSSKDPANFDDRADEFLAESLPLFVTQANELAEDVNAKQILATEAATAATEQAGIAASRASAAASSEVVATAKASEAFESAAAAFDFKGAAATSEENAGLSAAAAAASAASVDASILRWMAQPIGVAIPFRDDWAGADIPPTDNPNFRYIKLTAADAYNAGVLTGETVSGSAPSIVATAVISLNGSPLNGQVIDLENTMRTFDRAGRSGVIEGSQNASHSHTANAVGDHGHTGTTAYSGDHNHGIMNASGGANTGLVVGAGSSGPVGGFIAAGGNHQHTFSTSANGSHSHTINATGGDEARPRNIGKNYYMRVK